MYGKDYLPFSLVIVSSVSFGVAGAQNAGNGKLAFTALQIESHYTADGTSVHPTDSVHVIWPDGSNEDIRETIDGRPVGLRVIKDLDRKTKVVADPATALKTTYLLSREEVESANEKQSCSDLPNAGQLLGYSVVLETQIQDRGSQRTVTTRKLAPSLNCFSLSDYSSLEDLSGNKLGSASKTVTRIILATPDRADLSFADHFTEIKASGLIAAHDRIIAGGCANCQTISGSLLDQVYSGAAANR